MADQWPSPSICSFGTEPSRISTNGSSSPASACHQAFMKSCPFS